MFQRAAGLSFTTMISLIPLAVLFFSFVGVLGGGDRINEFVREKVFPIVAPDFKQNLIQWMDEYISPTAFRQNIVGWTNLLAIVGLIGASLQLVSTAERYLNHIWQTRDDRSFWRRLTIFWLVLTLSPFVFLAMILLGEWVFSESFIGETSLPLLSRSLAIVIPGLVGAFGFMLIFRLLPNANVETRPAILGAIVSAALWEAARRGFFLYIQRQAGVTSFYSKLAAVPLFLIWIWVTWVIVLFGSECAHACQHLPRLWRQFVRPLHGGSVSKPALAVVLLRRLLPAFRGERAIEPIDDHASAIKCSPEDLLEMAEWLVSIDVLLPDPKIPRCFRIAQDPSHIRLSELVERILEHEHGMELAKGDGPFAKDIRPAWQAAIRSFGNRSLADLRD